MKKTLILLVLTIAPLWTMAQDNKGITKFDSNFAHVVYFWFKNPDNTSDKVKFEKSLHTFLENSKYAKTNFIGTPPKGVRDVVDDSFTYNLIVTFESAAAQAAYQDEEAHLTFIEECKDLWKKVIVYDAMGTGL
ncbi:MAG: Dabb family protein [Bacteroidota bacterium]